jgi:hypothetical protein
VWRIDPEGAIRKIEWSVPKGLQVETVVPDGPIPTGPADPTEPARTKGGGALWVVTSTQVLRLTLAADEHGTVRGEKLEPVATIGSASGAVARAGDGALLLANGGEVKRVTKEGRVSDVVEASAALGEIFGLALAGDGSLRLSDWEHGRLLQFKDGNLSELAAGLEHPSGLVLAKDGALLFKESGRQSNTTGRIRRVAADGKVSLIAQLRRDEAH